ncbi:DUF6053 domain-containing protein, partial [Faecalibacterium prausnitzii]|uniref:DUF6053 domain-containing protein n=1 Tax=Faecalibacterium prausnitzii TaxID=853 RepID=UPI003D27177E
MSPSPAFQLRERDALVGGPSGPRLSAQVATIWHKRVGPEGPPTRAHPRTFLEGLCANANAVPSRPRRNAAQIAAIRAPHR